MLTGRNLRSNAETLRRSVGVHCGRRAAACAPVFHTHGLFVATNIQLLTGGAMILLPGSYVDQVFAHLPRATTLMGVPTFYSRMVADPR